MFLYVYLHLLWHMYACQLANLVLLMKLFVLDGKTQYTAIVCMCLYLFGYDMVPSGSIFEYFYMTSCPIAFLGVIQYGYHLRTFLNYFYTVHVTGTYDGILYW